VKQRVSWRLAKGLIGAAAPKEKKKRKLWEITRRLEDIIKKEWNK
jgi:hypothetical protein